MSRRGVGGEKARRGAGGVFRPGLSGGGFVTVKSLMGHTPVYRQEKSGTDAPQENSCIQRTRKRGNNGVTWGMGEKKTGQSSGLMKTLSGIRAEKTWCETPDSRRRSGIEGGDVKKGTRRRANRDNGLKVAVMCGG